MDEEYDFPNLPANDGNWPLSLYRAHTSLQNAFRHTMRYLELHDPDPVALVSRINHLESGSIPLLEAIAAEAPNIGLPEAWVNNCSVYIGYALRKLREAKLVAHGAFVFHCLTISPHTDILRPTARTPQSTM